MRSALAVFGATVLALAAGCGSTVQGSPTVGSADVPKSPVPVAALEALLLAAAAVNNAMGASGMEETGDVYDTLSTSDPAVDPACLGVAEVGLQLAYTGSGWSAVRSRVVHQPGDTYDDWTNEAVVGFPAAKDASAFYDASVDKWPKCANRRYSYPRSNGSVAVWTVADVANDDGILSTQKTLEGGDGWGCQHALTASNNVVVDVFACSVRPLADAARTMAGDIRDRISS